jgi:thymidylate kinase
VTGSHAFHVLLGGDFAGKSSVLRELPSLLPSWQLLSTDEEFTRAEFPLIAQLRRHVVEEVLPQLGTAYSPDFLAALLQTAVIHLRDRIARATAETPVLVDSYYYKLLAKCRLAGAPDSPMFAWWRSFPQPRSVLYLDVRPATTWRRSGYGAQLNRLEHSGRRPERFRFESYQNDLRKLMFEEIRDLPVTVLDEQRDCTSVARDVARVLSGERG